MSDDKAGTSEGSVIDVMIGLNPRDSRVELSWARLSRMLESEKGRQPTSLFPPATVAFAGWANVCDGRQSLSLNGDGDGGGGGSSSSSSSSSSSGGGGGIIRRLPVIYQKAGGVERRARGVMKVPCEAEPFPDGTEGSGSLQSQTFGSSTPVKDKENK
ncbi:hypothetical protein E2C01_033728 [Portunus trituberculatus]|uniref:Uncharacterized protein n=1 Tax=Portunus trituberculatus TaxID=210409 RepID=A0A5B7F4Y2_PORTR|nr:hypothetical protein [Portunus trituberculatus]